MLASWGYDRLKESLLGFYTLLFNIRTLCAKRQIVSVRLLVVGGGRVGGGGVVKYWLQIVTFAVEMRCKE